MSDVPDPQSPEPLAPPPMGAPPPGPPQPGGVVGAPVVPPWLPAMPASAPEGGMYFDPASGLTLPMGTTLASVGRRIGAYFLAIPLIIGTLVIGYIVWGMILWGRGQTPTYQVLGMRSWRPETGRVAGFWWMALREVVGRLICEAVTVVALVSFILFLATNQRRALPDFIAGTVVLHDPNKALG